MNFLNPTVLFASLAALVPLLIHLFSRRRVKVVEFSSLKHLKAMQRRQVRRIKIRQWLLLLLRMLIILALVVAFSRPTTEGGRIGSHASVSAVILLDNSASMGRYVADGNLLEIARKRCEELLGTFGEADEVCLLELDPTGAADVGGSFASPAVAMEKLNLMQQGSAGADFETGLDRARELLAQAMNVNKEVYLITDLQRRSLPDAVTSVGDEVNSFVVELPLEDAENCGVTKIALGGELLLPGQEFEVQATVRNWTPVDKTDLIASMFIDGNRVAQTDFDIAADKETLLRFPRTLSRGGFHSGYVEISDDRYLADNRYYFSFYLPEVFQVLVIGEGASATLTTMALNPSPDINQYWSVKRATPTELSGVNMFEYDVIVLAGAPTLSETYYERLRLIVGQGKSLLVTYGADTDVETFNRYLSPLVGAQIDEPMRRDVSRAGYYTLSNVNQRHPVFSVFTFENNTPPETRFYSLPKVTPSGRSSVLAEFSGGHPALIESSPDAGQAMFFAGPIEPDYSDLSGRAFFVPFLSRLVEYLARDLSSYDLNLRAGERVTRTIAQRPGIAGPLEMTAPDSSVYAVEPQEELGRLVLKPTPTNVPGVYEVRRRGRLVDQFALNVEPAEGNLSSAAIDQFAVALGLDDLIPLAPEAPLEAAVAELRFGKELWQIFLWLAALLLAAEMIIARGTGREE